MERIGFDIGWVSLWRVLAVVLVAVTLFAVSDVLLYMFLALVISAGLSPFIDFLEDKGVPRILGALFIFVLFLSLGGLFMYSVLPIAIFEFSNLLDNLAALADDIFDVFGFVAAEDVLAGFDEGLAFLRDGIWSGYSIFSFASDLVETLAFLVAVVFVAFYLLLSRGGVEWFLRAIMPESSEEKVLMIYRRSKRRIGFWLQTQLLLSLIIGLMTYAGLLFLGVEHAFVLALVAAGFEVVPFVGPIFAGSLAVLVALSDSLLLGIYTVILFLIIQQFEGQVIIPSLMHKTVGVHPVVVLASLMIGFKLAGLIGMFVAVPAAVILQEALNDWISIKDHHRAMRKVQEEALK